MNDYELLISLSFTFFLEPVFKRLLLFSAADSSLFQAVLFLAAAVLYLIDWDEYLAFLVLCLALSWVNVLYFSRGQVQMGIYSVMIQKVVDGGRWR